MKLPLCICVWGSICQSMFICQGISPLSPGGPSVKVCLSGKLCALVFKASLLCTQGVHWLKKVCLPEKVGLSAKFVYLGGPLAKVGSSAKLCVPWGVHQPKEVHLLEKVGLSAKFCVPRGFIGQSRFVCQKSRFVCKVLCTWGCPLAKVGLSARKVGLSAKFCVPGGVHWPKKVCLPDLSSQTFRCGHHTGLFILHTIDQ